MCAQHEHERTLLEALNKFGNYKFSGKIGSESLLRAEVTLRTVSKSHFLLVQKVVVWGDPCSEGSETTNFGTDEQKSHMRLNRSDKQAHHCKVQMPDLSGSIY